MCVNEAGNYARKSLRKCKLYNIGNPAQHKEHAEHRRDASSRDFGGGRVTEILAEAYKGGRATSGSVSKQYKYTINRVRAIGGVERFEEIHTYTLY